VDLSIGSPVDGTPLVAKEALSNAANAPSYPLTSGSPELNDAMRQWWERRRHTGALSAGQVLPTIGSKEMVGLLPTLLGLGSEDTVVIPSVAYPTYAVGAAVVGATVVAEDDPQKWPQGASLVWINSPSNPTGAVLNREYLREAVARAREIGAVLVSDECYAELGWETNVVPSLLDQEITAGDFSGLMAGDETLVQSLLLARKHLGLIMPAPIQAAVAAVVRDDAHVSSQREMYSQRRDVVFGALRAARFQIDHSEAGLYAWVTRGEDCWATVEWFAERGVLVAPGVFYGEAGSHHVRVALTASDASCEAFAQRLVETG